jgi:hypothetical protein
MIILKAFSGFQRYKLKSDANVTSNKNKSLVRLGSADGTLKPVSIPLTRGEVRSQTDWNLLFNNVEHEERYLLA